MQRHLVVIVPPSCCGPALVSDNFLITCTNTDSTIKLKVRYDVVDRNIVRDTVFTQTGEPVDEIIFHRVSER